MNVSSSKRAIGRASRTVRRASVIAAAAAPLGVDPAGEHHDEQPGSFAASGDASPCDGVGTRARSSRSRLQSAARRRCAAAPSTCSLNGSSSAASLLAERAAEVAGVDAFEDAGELPVGERDVEVELADVAARLTSA